MDNKDLIKINERLDNIESRIYLIFDELQRKDPSDKCSFSMYASTLFTAQQIKEVKELFGLATFEMCNGSFKMSEFRDRFEVFRQYHLPWSKNYSLRVIAEGYIVEEKSVALCQKILADIKKHPEEHLQM